MSVEFLLSAITFVIGSIVTIAFAIFNSRKAAVITIILTVFGTIAMWGVTEWKLGVPNIPENIEKEVPMLTSEPTQKITSKVTYEEQKMYYTSDIIDTLLKEASQRLKLKEYEKAVEIYEDPALETTPEALHNLAYIYIYGCGNVEKNVEKGYEIYAKAMRLGFEQSAANLLAFILKNDNGQTLNILEYVYSMKYDVIIDFVAIMMEKNVDLNNKDKCLELYEEFYKTKNKEDIIDSLYEEYTSQGRVKCDLIPENNKYYTYVFVNGGYEYGNGGNSIQNYYIYEMYTAKCRGLDMLDEKLIYVE